MVDIQQEDNEHPLKASTFVERILHPAVDLWEY